MKSIRSLFMIVIGMIAFTATANTAKLEQKQKTEVVTDFKIQTPAVCVVNENLVAFVLTNVTAEPNDINVVQFKNVTESCHYLDIVADVGWRSSNQIFNKILKIDERIEIAKKCVTQIRETKTVYEGKAIIRCHTSYSASSGRACVDVDGTMIQVSWICPQSNGHTGSTCAYFGWEGCSC